MRPAIQNIARAAQVALALAALWLGASLALRPDPRDGLRRAEALFTQGRYHDARAAFARIAGQPGAGPAARAQALARLGMVQAVRGELPAASRSLGAAVGLGLAGRELEVARLYQGRIADLAGQPEEAARFWALVPAESPLAPLRRALEAEALLRAARYPEAEAAYRDALAPQLPPRWRAAAHARLAALRASADPAGARAEIALALAPRPSPLAPRPSPLAALAEPLLPPPSPAPPQIAAALDAPPEQRAQILGQLYLAAQLYPLAEAQFASVPSDAPGAVGAAAYAAYTRWTAGDRAGGVAALEQLVASYPGERRARALLAMAYLSSGADEAARAQLDAARAASPRDPDAHLVMGELLLAQREYPAAAQEYAAALRAALPERRGDYALALAQLHAATAVGPCPEATAAAQEAARLLPADPAAWSALSAVALGCGDAPAAREAAREAARLSPASPEAAYHLGRALAALGDRAAARTALVSAADLAPASEWRDRAERQLAALGL